MAVAERPLTWALLAPLPEAELRRRADSFWRRRVKGATSGWETAAGTRDYSALLDRNPGSEYTHEVPLAEALSKETARPIYVLYLREGFGDADVIDEYRGGKLAGSLPGDPREFAEGLGCPLPGFERPASRPRLLGVIMIEGAEAEQVARILADRPSGRLRIEKEAAGTLVYTDPPGDPPLVARDLSRAFPENDVYIATTGPIPGQFACQVLRAGQTAALYSYPNRAKGGLLGGRVVDSVKGEKDPKAIADKLRIPRALLALE